VTPFADHSATESRNGKNRSRHLHTGFFLDIFSLSVLIPRTHAIAAVEFPRTSETR
jgi:hypothetical protein